MNKGIAITLIIILVILVLGLTSVLIYAIVGRESHLLWEQGGIEKMETTVRKDEKFDISKIQNLDLNFISTDFHITLTQDKELRIVQYSNRELKQENLYQTRVNGNTFEFKEGKTNIGFWFFSFGTYPMYYDIYLPKEYVENLTIQGVSSDILLSEELQVKQLNLQTTSGDVKIENNIKANDVGIKTVSGGIEIGKVESQSIRLSSTSGDIQAKEIGNNEINSVSGEVKINFMKGRSNIKTTSGDIWVGEYSIQEDCNMKSTSGNIKVDLSRDSHCELRLKTTSGNIQMPNASAIVGEAPFHILEGKTTSGNIKVNLK